MQRILNTLHGQSRMLWWSALTIAALLLTACGPLGDGDDPTATADTIVQPTAANVNTPAATPSSAAETPSEPRATPQVSVSTPALPTPDDQGVPQATPDGPFTAIAGTPEVQATVDTGPTTPVADQPDSTIVGSDGTSGATPDQTLPIGNDDAGTSSADSPASPTSGTAELDELEPLSVASCNPETIPPFSGEQNAFLTNTDANLRTGPGTDCDTIGDGPIGINTPVTLLSGPVVRTDDDEFVWVQVQIASETGWVILIVLEPAT